MVEHRSPKPNVAGSSPASPASMVEQVSDAIYEACDYAIPLFMVEKCSRAAIEAVRQAFIAEGNACTFHDDKFLYFGGAEFLEDELKRGE